MALAFGKPMEIQEYDCDVGPMTAADFVEERTDQVDTNLFGRLTQQHILYSLNMRRLHKVGTNGRIIYSAYDSLFNRAGSRSISSEEYDGRSETVNAKLESNSGTRNAIRDKFTP